jgi:Kef-type K+ transport system membrane component KefB
VGTILTATSVTITAQTLMNLKQIRSKAGSTILGAAVIDDVLGLVVLSLVIALGPQLASGGPVSWHGLSITLGRMVVCLITIFWLGPPLTRWIFKYAGRLHGSHTEVAAALVVAFLLAFHAEWTGGMAAITGSYLAGLFVAATPAHQKVTHDLQPMVSAFFGPLFFVSIGLEINAWQISGHLGFFALLLAVAIVGKLAGCGAGAFFNGFGTRESLIVGVGMIPRGEVGLITASIGWAAGIVTRDIYVQVVVMVLVSTLITPGLLRFAFPKDALAEAVAAGANIDNVLEDGTNPVTGPGNV